MKKVLITYSVVTKGFFSTDQITCGEIVSFDPEREELSDVIEKDLQQWKSQLGGRGVVTVIDFKII